MKSYKSFIYIILGVATLTTATVGAPQRSFAQKTKDSGKKKITKITNPKEHKNTDTVGIVNGEVITYYDFKGVMTGYLKSFAKRAPDNIITDSMFTLMVDSTWDKIVGDILTEQEIEKRHLGVSPTEAVDLIVKDPPDFIRQQFTDSTGVLHTDFIRQALTDPRNDSITQMIVSGERIRLEQEKLMAAVAPEARTASARERAYDAWLKKQALKAEIEDRRLSFGYY